MNKFFIILLLITICSCNEFKKQATPNIILFLVDDLGWQDTSLPFHHETTAYNRLYHTPNMEKLARQGMKFTQAYASCVCSPSRISLMTGMNAARHRVTNWTLKKDIKTDGLDSILQTPDWNYNGLNIEEGINNTAVATTLPQLLKQKNYTTIHIGKAHFAAIDTPCADPTNCGFDINVAGHAAGAPGSYFGLDNFGNNADGTAKGNWSVPGLEKYHGTELNLTEVLTLEAKNILDTAITKAKPFFLYMSHYAVHTPIQKDSRFFEKYIAQGLDSIEAKYASMVEGMDKSLGDLMIYLDEKNLTENTVVMFMSDNGGLSAVARGGERHIHNAPLSSGKGSAYEGGVREPMIVKWPEKIKINSICNQNIIIEDFFPTILELAGINRYSTIQKIDGKSFYHLLTEKNEFEFQDPIIWHYPNIWGPIGKGIGAYSAIKKGKWKLIYFHKNAKIELYNLEKDISEKENVAKIESEKVLELSKILSNYLREVKAQMPIYKNSKVQVPWPDETI